MSANDETSADPFVAIATEDVLASLLTAPVGTSEGLAEDRISAPVVALFVAFDQDDRPLIRYPGILKGECVPARSTVALTRAQLGSQVVVLCESADPRRPIVLGVVQGTVPRENSAAAKELVTVQADDQRYELNAERQIVLRCGEASITLTRAGKVIIKGTYVLSRSSGYNKIKGAAVDIN